jgi:hypothetical protein
MTIAAISLIAVGAAGAVVVTRVIPVRTGDHISVNKSLGCWVETSTRIDCGGASNSRYPHIAAETRSNGEIAIMVEPDPRGIFPVLFIERAICNPKTGGCSLVSHN